MNITVKSSANKTGLSDAIREAKVTINKGEKEKVLKNGTRFKLINKCIVLF